MSIVFNISLIYFIKMWYNILRGGDTQKVSVVNAHHPHFPQGSQTENYAVAVLRSDVNPYAPLVLYTFYIDILTFGGVHMIVIALCSLLCDIIMVVYIIYDHRERQ